MYALTRPTGIRVSWRAGLNRRQKKPVMLTNDAAFYPINQLQYANKQLRRED
jgi:hypothetical protein